ncbi:cyclophilin-like fold protein [Enterococcus sp. AZ109]|uniref:cyclophilin-like fold protein n=1 Tax=Enterococcus sp. AZ109 TaxID=2774634 RepID=UPI003F1F5791
MKKKLRSFLIIVASLLLVIFIAGCSGNEEAAETDNSLPVTENRALNPEDTLIVYYSLTNNTHELAEHIGDLGNLELARIDAADAYPEDDNSGINDRVAEQQATNQWDELTNVPENLADYQTILVGFPIWSDEAAYPIQSFLAQHADELAGKNIIPFSTSAVVDDDVITGINTQLTELVPEANILPGLHLTSSEVEAEAVQSWLHELSLEETTAAEGTPIQVQVGENIFTGFINDTVTGQDFITHLPETFTFQTFMEGYPEKYAALDYALDTEGTPGDTPISGALDYNSDSQSLFVYYGEVGTYDELHRIGQITDPAFEDFVSQQEEDFEMEIRLVE